MHRLFLAVFFVLSGTQSYAAGDASAGQSKSQPCAACHGPDGNGVAALYPNIAGQNERYLVKQLRAIKSQTRAAPLMAGQLDSLTDQDLQDLSAFYTTQTAKVTQVVEDEQNPDLVPHGERIYRGGILDKKVAACSACHSPLGNGNPLAGFPSLRGQPAEYLVTQLTAYREHQRSTDEEYGGMMRGVAARMTDTEMKAVATYIQGLSGDM